MPANYSMNPTKPKVQDPTGGQVPGQTQPPATAMPAEPRNIRDYLTLARSRGQVPTFTNIPGGQGFNINQDPGMIPPQAIPQEPVSEYEKIPFARRMKMDPYVRAKERVKTMLPDIWQSMFPGQDPAMGLSPEDLKKWSGAVEQVTGKLLKQFDKQYEWSRKNEETKSLKRDKDYQYWQKHYADLEAKQQQPTDPETGMPVPVQEYVQKQIDIADEMKFKSETEMQERAESTKTGGIQDFDGPSILGAITRNPDLAGRIRQDVMASLSAMVGTQLSEQDVEQMRSDPQWKDTFNQETHKAIMQYQDEIVGILSGKQK